MKNIFISLSCFLSLILTLSWPLPSQARVLEKIYAVVNGETITLSEIKDYQNKLKNGGFLNDLLFSDPAERKKAQQNRDYLLKLLVDEKIIDFEVKQNGFLITEERVNKEVSTVAKRQNMSVSQLRESLRRQGVDFTDYRKFVKKSIERRQLVEKEITSKIKISEQDIVSHYLSKNSSGQSQVFEFSLAHILFKKGQKDSAQKVAQDLKSGKSFTTLVTKHSTDSDSKSKGGHFGEFKSGEMISSIEKAISGLKIGETSNVVSTPMGLHVFKVEDKKLVKDPEIEKQKQGIYQKLFSQAFKEQLNFWLLQKRKDAIIQINKS